MKAIARIFAMTPEVWERHANPWSAWTRLPIAPLLALAIWSRDWIAGWTLLPIAALLVWTWLNPRVFPRPRHTRAWASRAVMGERVWLARESVPIPRHHALWAGLLSGASALGLPPLVWGLWVYDAWAVVAGLALSVGPKLWFVDRMVWLWEDMADHPAYIAWRR
ncbi:MAG: DUF6653 family protein [Pseudomonadota bacterium]